MRSKGRRLGGGSLWVTSHPPVTGGGQPEVAFSHDKSFFFAFVLSFLFIPLFIPLFVVFAVLFLSASLSDINVKVLLHSEM